MRFPIFQAFTTFTKCLRIQLQVDPTRYFAAITTTHRDRGLKFSENILRLILSIALLKIRNLYDY